jgi:hypothetical protein
MMAYQDHSRAVFPASKNSMVGITASEQPPVPEPKTFNRSAQKAEKNDVIRRYTNPDHLGPPRKFKGRS